MLCPTVIVVLLYWGAVRPWEVIALSLVIGVTDALSMPAFQTIVPSIVARAQVPAAMALNSAQFNLSRILGPVLAGLVMSWSGALGAFAISALSYLPVIFIALWVLPTGVAVVHGSSADSRQLFSGVRHAARERPLRGAILTVLASSTFCAPLMTFCPVLVWESFHAGIGQFSLAVAAFGTGGLMGAAGLLGVNANRDRRRISTVSGLLYGVVVTAAAINHRFWALPLLLALGGAAMALCDTSANTLILAQAPAQLRGQAVALLTLAMRGGLAVGSLLTGILVNRLGVREALLINGIAAIAAQIWVARSWFGPGTGPSVPPRA